MTRSSQHDLIRSGPTTLAFVLPTHSKYAQQHSDMINYKRTCVDLMRSDHFLLYIKMREIFFIQFQREQLLWNRAEHHQQAGYELHDDTCASLHT